MAKTKKKKKKTPSLAKRMAATAGKAKRKESWKQREKRARDCGATPSFAKKYGLRKVTEEELNEHIRLRIKKVRKTTTTKGRKKKTMAKKKRKTAKRKTKAKKSKTRKTKAKRKSTKKRRAKTKAKAKRRSSKRKTRKSRRSPMAKKEIVRSVRVPKSKTQVVRVELTSPRRSPSKKRKTKRKSSKRKRNPTSRTPMPIITNPMEEMAMMENTGYLGGLVGNPNGPFAAASLKGYAVAAGGVGAGLVIADFLDRFVATRTPDDTENAQANNPWFGRDAAAAQRRRPDAMRLGAQAAGAVAAMALTYWTRNGNVLPWLFGGTAVGFGANLLKMLTDWYAMPAIFKVDDPTEDSLGNRLFPLEQFDVQDEVDTLFENWDSVPALAQGQLEDPVISSPLASPVGTGVYTLGKAGRGNGTGRPQPQGLVPGGRRFIGKPNMLGKRCNSCGGYGGCWADCRTMTGYMETGNCAECGDGNHPAANEKQCAYTVQPGDSLSQIAQASGTNATLVSSLNQGRSLQELSSAGNRVVLPYKMCMYISKMPEAGNGPPMPPGNGNGFPDMATNAVRGNPVIPSTQEGMFPGASNAAPFPPGVVPAQSVPPAMPGGTVPAQFGTTTMNAPIVGMSLAGKPNGDSRSPEERVMALFSGDD